MKENTYFLSDLHLGSHSLDNPREAEKRVVDFLDSIKEDAKAIYLLGDILDYWYEYRNVVPRGFVRFFGKIAELSDNGTDIFWFIGNHDIWIFDYIPNELGIEVIDGTRTVEIDGKTFFLTHGDGVGKIPRTFRFIRSLFRNRLCQKLYASIHPRWTIPFALKWSKTSRENPRSSSRDIDITDDPLMQFTKEYSAKHPEIDFFIYGHRHILLRTQVNARSEMIILGEWINTFSYAVFNGNDLSLHRYKR